MQQDLDFNKYKIFDHVIDTYKHIATQSGFKYGLMPNKYVLSGYPSAVFNFFYLKEIDDLLKNTLQQNIPFLCFPQKEFKQPFKKDTLLGKFRHIDNPEAHQFNIAENYHYHPNHEIQIECANNDETLDLFDMISSQCYRHPKDLAANFLKQIKSSDKFCKLFVAFYKSKPVGTGMISFVDQTAGIDWLSVLPFYRRQGIATQIVHHLIDYAQTKGYDKVVSQNLTPSKSLFKKIGFVSYGSIPLYLSSS